MPTPVKKPRAHARSGTKAPNLSQRALLVLGVTGAVVLASVLAVVRLTGGGDNGTAPTTAGLPNTPDYHSLLVDPGDPQKLILGTHIGLYVSSDAGRHWRFEALSGNDAMNLARPTGKTVWLAGHNVFKKSTDDGKTWTDARPAGLPSLDIHGFSVDPRDPRKLYAAVAGNGLYRSDDNGASFQLLSSEVGGAVMALAVMRDGRILAGDMQRGLLESRDDGKTWRKTLGAQLMGLAVNPDDPKRLLATGGGIALSTDGGATWRVVLNLAKGAGPVAWSQSNPKLAYVVGLNKTLFRSTDAGENWQSVAAGS